MAIGSNGAHKDVKRQAGVFVAGYNAAMPTTRVAEILRKHGSIVLFGGLAKDRPYPGSTTVSTVNGGVMTMVHTLAVELAPLPRGKGLVLGAGLVGIDALTSRVNGADADRQLVEEADQKVGLLVSLHRGGTNA